MKNPQKFSKLQEIMDTGFTNSGAKDENFLKL